MSESDVIERNQQAVGATRRRPRSSTRNLLESAVVIVGAILVAFLVKTFVVQAFQIPSASMHPTLLEGDRVLVNKLSYRLHDINRGDVVVFDRPTSMSAGPNDPKDLIKRVIGLPGDHVTCDGKGPIKVNGVAIAEPYLKPGNAPSTMAFDIHVPAGKVWVMGDHRSDSGDSRLHDDGTGATGSVPIEDIKGRAILVVWPLNRFTWLSVPASIYSGIPTPSG